MKLSEILKGIDVLNSYEETEILDVTQDSRLVKSGESTVEHFDTTVEDVTQRSTLWHCSEAQ